MKPRGLGAFADEKPLRIAKCRDVGPTDEMFPEGLETVDALTADQASLYGCGEEGLALEKARLRGWVRRGRDGAAAARRTS